MSSTKKSNLKVRSIRFDPEVLEMCKKLAIDINDECRRLMAEKVAEKISERDSTQGIQKRRDK